MAKGKLLDRDIERYERKIEKQRKRKTDLKQQIREIRKRKKEKLLEASQSSEVTNNSFMSTESNKKTEYNELSDQIRTYRI